MKQLSFQSMTVKLGCRKLAKYDPQLNSTTIAKLNTQRDAIA